MGQMCTVNSPMRKIIKGSSLEINKNSSNDFLFYFKTNLNKFYV